MSTTTVRIVDIATAIGLVEEDFTLPNGKPARGLVWRPEHLSKVFQHCDGLRSSLGLGRNDVVVIDGVCPAWLLACVSHGFHPCSTAVSYRQAAGAEPVNLPVGGTVMEAAGAGENLAFTVTAGETATTVEFRLTVPQIDAAATLKSLVAPVVPAGKPVVVTGRGLISIAAALADAYAHRVPAVACFQPGTGNVVCISHDAAMPLGTVV
ncbi:MAG: CRISPR-associated protein Csx3 [Candidatus Peregrinibacteria bacterium]